MKKQYRNTLRFQLVLTALLFAFVGNATAYKGTYQQRAPVNRQIKQALNQIPAPANRPPVPVRKAPVFQPPKAAQAFTPRQAIAAKKAGGAPVVEPAKVPTKVTMEEAAKQIGQHVFVATGSAMPPDLVPYMRQTAMAREGRTNVYYMSTFASQKNFSPEVSEKFHPNLFFISSGNRDAATKGHATRHRASLHQLSQRIQNGDFPFDTVVVRVSPPDQDGNVSLGTTGDLTLLAVEQVRKRGGQIIAEVNPNVPHVRGNRIPYMHLTTVFESKEMLSEFDSLPPNAIEHAIAMNVAKLVPNNRRSTLQVGIGNALMGIGKTFANKRLRIWSEMGSDWVVPLMGGEKPKVKEGVFSFLHGSGELYKLANDNPNMRIGHNGEINDPQTIATKKRMVAVNTALQVDIFGNVNAEQIGDRVISAPGGQPDFMDGASRAPDGKAILAIRSLAKEDASTIVIDLQGPTTTPKNHVDHVVTEWGATKQLRKLSDADRVYELIRIAHPIHRATLAKTALEKNTISQKQHDKLLSSIFHSVRLSDATTRAALADRVLQGGFITDAQHREIIKSIPAPAVPAEVAAAAPVPVAQP